MDKSKLGGLAFIIGLVIAIIFSVFASATTPTWVFFVLAVLGLIVGLFNVTDKEMVKFLLASLVFLMSFQALGGILTTLAFGWDAVATFFTLLSVFVAPAAALVAFVALLGITKD
ncbi:hypothetical protein ACFL1B_00470 [Nanoarchaeota archaeon]